MRDGATAGQKRHDSVAVYVSGAVCGDGDVREDTGDDVSLPAWPALSSPTADAGGTPVRGASEGEGMEVCLAAALGGNARLLTPVTKGNAGHCNRNGHILGRGLSAVCGVNVVPELGTGAMFPSEGADRAQVR